MTPSTTISISPSSRDLTAHARSEVATRFSEHNNFAARHVLAPVVAHAFYHRHRAAVAHLLMKKKRMEKRKKRTRKRDERRIKFIRVYIQVHMLSSLRSSQISFDLYICMNNVRMRHANTQPCI
jgi:hypothetical protein